MTGCPTLPVLEQFLSENLEETHFLQVASHIDTCPGCQSKLESVAQDDRTRRWRVLREASGRLNDSSYTYTYNLGEFGESQQRQRISSEAVDTRPLPSIPGHEILSILGRGGMGVVYKARHVRLDRVVAVKMILAAEHADTELFDRFLTEARAVARLQHPNILQIHEIGDHEGNPFYSMEYADGGSLAETLSEELLPPKEAAGLTKTLADAMHYAHQAGIIHRDLKPANILLESVVSSPSSVARTASKQPRTTAPPARGHRLRTIPKIADFGLAKELQADSGQTQTGAIIGSPSYMAYEQAASQIHQIGPRTDVYALGAILYESLTGRPPFKGASVVETLDQVRLQEPVPPRQLQPKAPRDLETICLKCLEKRTDKRYADAQLLADDLERFLDGRPILARPVGHAERTVKWVRRRPAIAALLAATLLLLVALAAGSIFYVVRMGQYTFELATSKSTLEQTNKELKGLTENLKKATKRAQKNEQIAKAASKQAEKDRQQAERDRDRAILEVAKRDREKGLRLCHNGDVNLGMLYLARSLKFAPVHAKDFRHCLLINLAAWENEIFSPKSIRWPATPVNSAAFSPDGKSVIWGTTYSPGPFFWNVATGKKIGPRIPHKGVVAVAFSPDGKTVLTGSLDKTARLWNAKTGQPIGPPLRHKGRVHVVAFGPDGKTAITAGSVDRTAQLWDLTTGKPVGPPLRHQGQVYSAAYSPTGKMVATGGSSDRTVRLWDAATGEPIGPALGHNSPIRCVAFNPDGKLVVTTIWDGEAWLWDVETHKPIGFPLQHEGRVNTAAFRCDGKVVITASDDATARLWDVVTGKPVGPPLRHNRAVDAAIFSPDGKTVITISGNTPQLWDVTSSKPTENERTSRSLWPWVISPDGKYLLSIWTSRRVDVETGKPYGRPLQRLGQFQCAAISPDGKTVIAGGIKSAQLWDIATGKPIGAPLQHGNTVEAVAFSPDSKIAVTGSFDSTARLWDTATGKPIGSALRHRNRVIAVAFSPDGKTVLTGSLDKTARLWDIATGKPIGPPLRHGHWVNAVAFSPDGKTILTGSSDKTGRLWDAATGKPIGPPLQHQSHIFAVAFSPAGDAVITGSMDKSARLWDAATGKPIGPPLQHKNLVYSVAISPDGKIALTGSDDKTARLWDVATCLPIGPPIQHGQMARRVAFSPDGKIICTGFEGKLTRVPTAWPDNIDQSYQRVQARTGLALQDDDEILVLDAKEITTRRAERLKE